MKLLSIDPIRTRKDRTEWLYHNFKDIFKKGVVLDAGCDDAPLRNIIGKNKYFGIDVIGNYDLKINLENFKKLPFKKNEFETTICIEVLEHLDNLHVIANDLFRVTKSHLLISLPNSWRDSRKQIERGRGTIGHYGLPITKPLDRHKWFINTQEAVFFFQKIKPKDYQLEITITEPKRNFVKKLLRTLWYSSQAYQNKFGQTIWAKYSKIR